jgi:glyoxylase-like metal-dependent hydrolase (beta-lactamase superfamily II)
MSNLTILEIKSSFGAGTRSMYPVVIRDGKELILVDTGLPGQFELIKETALSKGIALSNLTKIVITHQDIDHIGSLAAFKKAFNNVKVFSSVIEADYISGKKESIRIAMSKKNFENMPEEQKANALNFQKMFEKLERTTVDITLNEDGLLPDCTKTKVIHTPGHLPGHMSVYFEETKTLITGDAFGLDYGTFLFNPNYTTDKPLAKESVKKLLNYDITNIVCYHGGYFEGDCKKVFHELIES